jgi:phospholipid-binding lipoprotein MlaA
MLAAHLAGAALAIAPAGDGAVQTPLLTDEATVSAQQRVFEELPEPAFGAALPAPEPAEPLDGVTPPVEAKQPPAPDTSLDDIDLAAPKLFPDPLEPINRISYAITQPIDRFVLRPLAMTYQAVVPKPARDGARNAIRNIREPVVFVNDLIQLRPGRALRTLGRFLINSTIGVFGLFDIAKREPFHLKHHANGFGSTLGYYGVGPLLYLYLPVLGPTTLRDSAAQYGDSLIGDRLLDKAINPNSGRSLFKGSPQLGTTGTAITIVDGLDLRAENDEDLRHIAENSIDPYAALRADFLQDRAGEIAELRAKDGEAPRTEAFDDPLVDPEAAKAVP